MSGNNIGGIQICPDYDYYIAVGQVVDRIMYKLEDIMKKLFLVLAIVLMASASWAAPFLVCDPQEGVIGYTLTGLTDDTIAAQADGSLKYDLASLPNGTYEVTVAACNIWRCGEPADPFPIKKQLPVAPAGLRIVAE